MMHGPADMPIDPTGSSLAGDASATSAVVDPRRVVFLAYFFPPMGGAGTQRAAAFARHLPSLGYEPVVVCAGERRPGAHTIAHDPTLLAGLADALPITRIDAMEYQQPSRRDRLNHLRLIGSAREIAWARRAADAAVFAARRHHAVATIISVSPYLCATCVHEIRRRTGRPVLLDLRDPWALDGWRTFRTPLQRWFDRRTMRRSLRAADMVIANCPVAGAAYRTMASLPSERVVVIPNGFETSDFPARRSTVRRARPAAPDAPFHVVHVGTLHDPDHAPVRPGSGRAFPCGTVERTLRSGRTLIRAAGRLRRLRPELAERLRLDFYGRVHAGHLALADAEGVRDLLTVHDYVAHDEVPRILSHADVISVPLHGVAPGDEALVVPGKLYEAVASGRPVLATVPNGDARRLVRLAGGDGRVFGPGDEAGVADALAAWLEGASEGWRPEGAPRELLEPFSRRRLAERLARAVSATLGETEAPADDPWIELAEVVSQLDGGTALATITAAKAASVAAEHAQCPRVAAGTPDAEEPPSDRRAA